MNWRFYAKQKIFEAVEAACSEGEPADEAAVQQAYAQLLDRQPQLKTQLELS